MVINLVELLCAVGTWIRRTHQFWCGHVNNKDII